VSDAPEKKAEESSWWDCSIDVTALRRIDTHGLDIREALILPGDKIHIERVHLRSNMYQCLGPRGRFHVPRWWLVECGALKPHTDGDRAMVKRLVEAGDLPPECLES
jgi:hypothetical protein